MLCPPTIQEYTHPERGIFNCATVLLLLCIICQTRPTDLGPKGYISQKGLWTNLHTDVASAWNIMVNCVCNGSAKEGHARWEIFKRKDFNNLTTWLRTNMVDSFKGHPIYDQRLYLTWETVDKLVTSGKSYLHPSSWHNKSHNEEMHHLLRGPW